jgi:F-type H+-transporting ATPase subunit delta
MSVETVARRYSVALADVVANTKDAETVKTELKIWEEMMGSSSELHEVFGNPSIPHTSKEKVLEGLLKKAKPSKITANFLRVLLRNGRLTNLANINQSFAKVLEERAGVVAANVVSARPLSDGEKKDLQNKAEQLAGKKINLNFEIDQNIIGGVVTTIGSTVYDGSIKTKLENLKQQLANG